MNIYDSLHGFISLSELEARFIASPLFQRLRYIHQMGAAYLVYPGATNKRFEHSLGTLYFASKIYRRLVMEASTKHLPKESFPEVFDIKQRRYWQSIIRFAALCHDLGHTPFSHLLEDIFIPNGSHEDFSYKCIFSKELSKLWKDLSKELGAGLSLSANKVAQHIAKLALGEKYFLDKGLKMPFTPWERILCQIITGDNFGADRMDYLLRDSKATGLSYGIFDHEQLIKLLRIVPLPLKGEEKAWTIGVHIDGLQAVESLLLSRYFMFSRVYHNPKVHLFSLCLQRFASRNFKTKIPLKNLNAFSQLTDIDILYELQKALKSKKHPDYELATQITERKLPFDFLRLKNSPNSIEKYKSLYQKFGEKVSLLSKKNTAHSPTVIYNYDNEVFFASSLSPIYTQIPQAPSELYLFYEKGIEKKLKLSL